MKKIRFSLTRMTAMMLVLVCMLGLLPATALAASPSTIKMDDCTHNGVKYESPALGTCHLHQMHFGLDGKSTMGFCAEKGKGMGWSLEGHTWGNPQPISDPTVTTMMAYFYAHSTGVFTDQAKALGVDDVWDSGYTWTMNAWVQAIIWRYKAGLLSDPVTACAEELLCVYNNLEHTSYTSIDDVMGDKSFRDRAQYILDLGAQGVWGECSVYEYAYTGSGSKYHPASDVQAIMIGELNITRQKYDLTVKKVDSTNPNKGLPGARFKVASENGTYSKEIVTGSDGTYTLSALDAGTYSVTELEAPEGYEIDNPGPQYVVLPNGSDTTVTVTFTDTPEITGEGSIRKVDADDPTKGLAGTVIEIIGVDNDFTGTYVTGAGGYLTDIPWKDMPIGSYTATEVTPPEGYTKSPETSKVKQSFRWDGKTDVALVFENDAVGAILNAGDTEMDAAQPGAVRAGLNQPQGGFRRVREHKIGVLVRVHLHHPHGVVHQITLRRFQLPHLVCAGGQLGQVDFPVDVGGELLPVAPTHQLELKADVGQGFHGDAVHLNQVDARFQGIEKDQLPRLRVACL